MAGRHFASPKLLKTIALKETASIHFFKELILTHPTSSSLLKKHIFFGAQLASTSVNRWISIRFINLDGSMEIYSQRICCSRIRRSTKKKPLEFFIWGFYSIENMYIVCIYNIILYYICIIYYICVYIYTPPKTSMESIRGDSFCQLLSSGSSCSTSGV